MISKIRKIIIDCLEESSEIINHDNQESDDYSDLVLVSTSSDVKISKMFTSRLKTIPARIMTEETKPVNTTEKPVYLITVDPLDGSANYKKGKHLLPYVTIVTVFDSLKPKIRDALYSVVYDLAKGNLWEALRGGGCYFNSKKCKPSPHDSLDSKCFGVIDNYLSRGVDNNLIKYLNKNCLVRDFGSAGLHLAGVSSGVFDFYFTPSQKHHELGAGYLLIKEAGGVVTDLQGNEIGDMEYDFNSETGPIIAAGNRLLLEKIIENK